MNWLDRFLGRSSQIIQLEKELADLREQWAKREAALIAIEQDVERSRLREESRISAGIADQFIQLFQQLANPLAELASLKSAPETNPTAIADRLFAPLVASGLSFIGQPNETVPFDPNLHRPLPDSFRPLAGAPVRIQIVGIRYRGALLRKADVSP